LCRRACSDGALAEAHEPGSALEGTLGDSEKWDLAILNSFLAGKDKCSRSNAIETLLDSGHIELSYAYRAQRGHCANAPHVGPTIRSSNDSPRVRRSPSAKADGPLQEFDLRHLIPQLNMPLPSGAA